MEQRKPAPGDSTPSVPWTAPEMGGHTRKCSHSPPNSSSPSLRSKHEHTRKSSQKSGTSKTRNTPSSVSPSPITGCSKKWTWSSSLPFCLNLTVSVMGTHVTQWNMRGFRTKYRHFRLLLSHTNSIVNCLQECRMPLPLPSFTSQRFPDVSSGWTSWTGWSGPWSGLYPCERSC